VNEYQRLVKAAELVRAYLVREQEVNPSEDRRWPLRQLTVALDEVRPS
jgi:hypothetical protein